MINSKVFLLLALSLALSLLIASEVSARELLAETIDANSSGTTGVEKANDQLAADHKDAYGGGGYPGGGGGYPGGGGGYPGGGGGYPGGGGGYPGHGGGYPGGGGRCRYGCCGGGGGYYGGCRRCCAYEGEAVDAAKP